MSTSPRKTFRLSHGVLMACAILVLLITVLNSTALDTERADATFLRATVGAYTDDAGLKLLRGSSENDPTLTKNGLLTADAQRSECPTVARSLTDFQHRWLDVPSYDGHVIHSHAVAVMLLMNSEALAARNGCISTADFTAYVAHVRSIRDHDLSSHGLSDWPRYFPLLGHDGHMPVFFTIHGLDARYWHDVLDGHAMASHNCVADLHCDPLALMKAGAADRSASAGANTKEPSHV